MLNKTVTETKRTGACRVFHFRPTSPLLKREETKRQEEAPGRREPEQKPSLTGYCRGPPAKAADCILSSVKGKPKSRLSHGWDAACIGPQCGRQSSREKARLKWPVVREGGRIKAYRCDGASERLLPARHCGAHLLVRRGCSLRAGKCDAGSSRRGGHWPWRTEQNGSRRAVPQGTVGQRGALARGVCSARRTGRCFSDAWFVLLV